MPPAERPQSRAHDLVEDLDPSFAGVDALDRQRPAHRNVRIAGEMHETAGLRTRCAFRCRHSQHELFAGPGFLGDHGSVFEKNTAAVRRMNAVAAARLVVGQGAHHLRPSITASSTAMRTATPLRTWSRITDCGPSATSEAISMP